MVRLTLAVLALAACSSPAAVEPDAAGAPAPLTKRIDTYTVAAGEEVTNRCVSWTLGNDQPLYVNAVTLATGSGFHHSNWFWVPETSYAGPDGIGRRLSCRRGQSRRCPGSPLARGCRSPLVLAATPGGVRG